ncbi:MAG: diphosphomevalonate decarboxylase, partial [Candidatus Micrarchaeota archaeon]
MKISANAIAAPNIALIKYWGKRNDLLKLPLNDSVSFTLDKKKIWTRTKLIISDEFKKDDFYLNGKKCEDGNIKEWLKLVRKRLGKKYPKVKWRIKITSRNNFPSSAGIASSASGFAAASAALCSALKIKSKKEMSIIARLGSGSASRSVFGGFVRWKKGKRKDGNDSYSVQIAKKKHWNEIVDV